MSMSAPNHHGLPSHFVGLPSTFPYEYGTIKQEPKQESKQEPVWHESSKPPENIPSSLFCSGYPYPPPPPQFGFVRPMIVSTISGSSDCSYNFEDKSRHIRMERKSKKVSRQRKKWSVTDKHLSN